MSGCFPSEEGAKQPSFLADKGRGVVPGIAYDDLQTAVPDLLGDVEEVFHHRHESQSCLHPEDFLLGIEQFVHGGFFRGFAEPAQEGAGYPGGFGRSDCYAQGSTLENGLAERKRLLGRGNQSGYRQGACRLAEDRDVQGIASEFGGIFTDPPKGSLLVFQPEVADAASGQVEVALGAEPVGNLEDDHVTFPGHPLAAVALFLAASTDEGTSMYPDHYGKVGAVFRGICRQAEASVSYDCQRFSAVGRVCPRSALGADGPAGGCVGSALQPFRNCLAERLVARIGYPFEHPHSILEDAFEHPVCAE